ncbi:hypothetical protein NKW44_14640 [Acetobacter lovaniensis]|jgi:hypothetical protein|uniref:DUF6876 family protein n=1 Tax=Acetobacter lovaniensis TaxID=104100 RepID=UPI0020A11914|nr:DUF6876 family protein [Acetobacter lovaniensis]MCP1240897.1 hypothetical protein [Acetobacter lovaniensis]
MSIESITQANLSQFTGTVNYTRFMGNLLLTDGVMFLAKNGAGWILDIIASVRRLSSIKAEEKEFWTLKVDLDSHTAVITATDGDKGDGPIQLYHQVIDYTDFPLKELKLYVIEEGPYKVVMLPTEY